MAKKTNNNLIIAILVAGVLIAGGLVYLGQQMNGGGDLDAQIEQGIQDFVAKQQGGGEPAAPVNVRVDDDAVLGDPKAPVTIVEFSDYECPFCGRFFSQTLPDIQKKYIDTGKVKLVYRDFPLNFHPLAMPAAIAAECVRDQTDDKAYFAYHDTIFANQPSLSIDNLKVWAAGMGLNAGEFNECLDGEKFKAEVTKDFTDGQSYGVQGTPAFFINGRLVSGAQPFAVFEQIIEEELKK